MAAEILLSSLHAAQHELEIVQTVCHPPSVAQGQRCQTAAAATSRRACICCTMLKYHLATDASCLSTSKKEHTTITMGACMTS